MGIVVQIRLLVSLYFGEFDRKYCMQVQTESITMQVRMSWAHPLSRPIMNLSDAAEVEKLSEAEFTDHAISDDISKSLFSSGLEHAHVSFQLEYIYGYFLN